MQQRFLGVVQLWPLLLAVSASSALLGALAADLSKGELSCFLFAFPQNLLFPCSILLNVAYCEVSLAMFLHFMRPVFAFLPKSRVLPD